MRNEPTLEAICDALTANCGDMLRASKQCGVSLLFIQQWRKDDKEVDQRISNACELGTQTLVSAAITRGVYGIERGVYYKGEKVDTQLEYSDTLLQTLLKAKVREFSVSETSAPKVTVNIANLMPRAETYEQWLEMKKVTLEQAALPSPDAYDELRADDSNIIEVDFVSRTPAALHEVQSANENAFEGIDL